MVDPFSDFSIPLNLNQNDPFTTVVTRLPEQPATIHQASGSFIPSEKASYEKISSGLQPTTNSGSSASSKTSVTPSSLSPTNNQAPLIDLREFDSFPSQEPRSPSSLSSAVTSDEPLFSSGSLSSTGSGKRFSSSASSSSDGGTKSLNYVSKKEQNTHPNKKGTE